MEIYQTQLSEYFKNAVIAIFGAVIMMMSFLIMPWSTASAAEKASPDKVEAVYFWGAECPHCKNLKPWLDEFEEKHKDTFKTNRYEFWHDKNNAMFFMSTMEMYHIPENEAGAPSMVINNKVLIGSKEIKDNLETEYNAALEKINEKKAKGEGLLTGGEDLGEKIAKTSQAKDIGAITVAALADSINPCAMAVLVILLSSLVVMQKNKARIALTAFSFVLASYIMYFFVGLGLAHVISAVGISEKIIIAVGALAIVVGLAELKDAIWYQKGGWSTEIPQGWKAKLSKLVLSVTSPVGAFAVGLAVTFFELPCTGGPYLFGLSLISQHSTAMKMLLLAYYNLIFVLPLIIISLLVIVSSQADQRIEAIDKFRNSHVRQMHFFVGVIMMAMGVWALFVR